MKNLKAQELIDILSRHPFYEIQVETEQLITDVESVDVDVFDREEGPVFVIKPELE